ncbi:exopolysaccharide biosynthesis protein [Aerococcus urinaehominis]|uniref:Tyrosine-protein kinase CpsD n=1 Tax=Aerococcus urinaehominis TaxID=128944 RepID=A0A120IAT4_9LACT|nr:CpsD/CapB family tyrosine-protein kinase [Aerococcus urinaehominis]AMB99071.1 exopolysaccharide biosynthesis protein [Aerococcus urinaehominis]SDM02533.1 capsular exopolysaccharide family [Aerococcus urinaehominis]
MFNRKAKKIEALNAEQKKGASLITVTKPNNPVSEMYRTLRTNIQFSVVDSELKSMMVTSSGPFEGKSMTTANLAAVMADQDMRVLLVDADMRKPTVQKTFDIHTTEGLTSLLTERDKQPMDVIKYVPETNVYVLTAGPKPPNPAELLSSQRMKDIFEELKTIFDLIIFDTPPVLAVTDAQIIANMVDGVVMVVRQNVAQVDNLHKAKQLLEKAQANVLGVVYNGIENSKDAAYGYGYGYGVDE